MKVGAFVILKFQLYKKMDSDIIDALLFMIKVLNDEMRSQG